MPYIICLYHCIENKEHSLYELYIERLYPLWAPQPGQRMLCGLFLQSANKHWYNPRISAHLRIGYILKAVFKNQVKRYKVHSCMCLFYIQRKHNKPVPCTWIQGFYLDFCMNFHRILPYFREYFVPRKRKNLRQDFSVAAISFTRILFGQRTLTAGFSLAYALFGVSECTWILKVWVQDFTRFQV